MPTMFQVGKPYQEGKHAWPELLSYEHSAAGHFLRLFLRSPSQAEIQAAWYGPARFGLFLTGDVIFLFFKFWQPGGPVALTGECPYTWHILPPDYRKLPNLDIDPSEGAALSVILVDAENGIIKAIRVLAFTHRFTMALHRAIHDQAARPFDQVSYDKQLERAFAAYDTKRMWEQVLITCKAGEKD